MLATGASLRHAAAWASALMILGGAFDARASKVSDLVTIGSDKSVSNGLQAAIDLAEPFTLEAGWTWLDSASGKINTFNLGGDLRFGQSFDIDTQANLSPRANGVLTFGLTLTPTYVIEENDDLYTVLSVPLSLEHTDVNSVEHTMACMKQGVERPCGTRGATVVTHDTKMNTQVNDLGFGLMAIQGIYDGSLTAGITYNVYSEGGILNELGREVFRFSKFNQLGGVLPTFPVKLMVTAAGAYSFRLVDNGVFSLKPVVSWSHLVYEAQHGHGDTLIAKLVGKLYKTVEITAGYQVFIDRELDTTMKPPTPQSTTVHYGLVGLAWIFGEAAPPSPEPGETGEELKQEEHERTEPAPQEMP